MALRKRDLERIFQKLEIERQQCKHHIRGFIKHKGKKVFSLHYSFGRGELPGRIQKNMARSIGLSEEEFTRMAKCKISKCEYFSIQKERGNL